MAHDISAPSPIGVRLPYSNLIGLDAFGRLELHMPHTIESFSGSILTAEIKNWFRHITNLEITDKSSDCFEGPGYAHRSLDFHSKKRRRDHDEAEHGKDIPLEIGDEEKVESYYVAAFEAFQQLNCRQVAKAYIKMIEPKKQVKHPYNGGQREPGIYRDPEKTKPNWWPSDVAHREPDPLLKKDRVKLLVHILRNLKQSHDITVDKLEEAGRNVEHQIKPLEKLGVLDEIYEVRRMEERYERGEIDEGTVISVVSREKKAKSERDSETPREVRFDSCFMESDDYPDEQAADIRVKYRMSSTPTEPVGYLGPSGEEYSIRSGTFLDHREPFLPTACNPSLIFRHSMAPTIGMLDHAPQHKTQPFTHSPDQPFGYF